MSESQKPVFGTFGWTDLTVENADEVRDFYASVVGWGIEPCDMGGYSDYTMTAADGTPVGGVCHARGTNAEMPPVWMVYVNVEDLAGSLERCREQGGEVVLGPKGMGGHGSYAVIRDPAGAMMALFEPT